MNEISEKQRKMVMGGCLMLCLAIAAYGLSLSTIQGPLLDSLGGSQYFSVVTVLSAIAMCVMTPIGGRLADMIGGKKLILIFGSLSIACGLLMAFIPNIWCFIVFRTLLSACQGAFASLPYILVREIYPPEQTPKAIGYLTMFMAIGGLVGSYLAGWLNDMGMDKLAIAFPLIPMAFAIPMIAMNLKESPTVPFKLDWLGIILLTVSLGGLLLGLNNGPTEGWFSMPILISFGIGIICLICLIAWEGKAEVPVIPMHIFKIKEYSLLLLIAFCLMIYMNAMNVYIPLAVQSIMNAGSAASGAIQIPKTIMTILLPSLCGAWVIKKSSHIWQSLAISAITIIIPFGLLVFIGPKMPLWFVLAVLAFTGISDSFRSVGLLPAAQSCLTPKDMGVGTSLIGFISTLAGSIGSALYGLAYDSLTNQYPGIIGMTKGVDTINLMVTVIAVIGLLLVIFFFRPIYNEKVKKAKEAKVQAAKQ